MIYVNALTACVLFTVWAGSWNIQLAGISECYISLTCLLQLCRSVLLKQVWSTLKSMSTYYSVSTLSLTNIAILCQRKHRINIHRWRGCSMLYSWRSWYIQEKSIPAGVYAAEPNWKPLQFSWCTDLWGLPPFRKIHLL